MYSIGKIIYGIPLVNGQADRSEALDEFVEDESLGVLTYYSGSADETPAAFGVELGSFDAIEGAMDMAQLALEPTTNQIVKFGNLWSSLDPTLQAEINKVYGQPRTFVLWTTS